MCRDVVRTVEVKRPATKCGTVAQEVCEDVERRVERKEERERCAVQYTRLCRKEPWFLCPW